MLAERQIFTRRSFVRSLLPSLAPTTDLDLDSATRLRAAIGRLSRRLRTTAASRDAGLTPTAISLLLSIARTGPARLAELAETEGLNPTMLSRAVAGLVQDGLLERSHDEGDRRAAWVEATASGRRLAQRMRRERTSAVDAALEALSEAQRRHIEQALPALEALAEELKGRRP
jgi:DNA-binding MarR family transcriptional regulator